MYPSGPLLPGAAWVDVEPVACRGAARLPGVAPLPRRRRRFVPSRAATGHRRSRPGRRRPTRPRCEPPSPRTARPRRTRRTGRATRPGSAPRPQIKVEPMTACSPAPGRRSRSAGDFPRRPPATAVAEYQAEREPAPSRSCSYDSFSLPWVPFCRREQHTARFPCRQRIGGAYDSWTCFPVDSRLRPPDAAAVAPDQAQLTR